MNTQLRQGEKREREERGQAEHGGHRQLLGREKRRLEKGYPETQKEARGRQKLQKRQEGEAMVEPEWHQGAGAAGRQLSRHNWIRDNSAPAVRGVTHTQSNARHRNTETHTWHTHAFSVE